MKKLISLFVSFLFVSILTIPSFASETATTKTVASIIESVNQEYGVHYDILDGQQAEAVKAKTGLNMISTDTKLTSQQLNEFEESLRQSAASLAKDNASAKAAFAKAKAKVSQTNPLGKSTFTSSSERTKSGKKRIKGAIAYFEGTAYNGNGYWTWESVEDTYAVENPNDNNYRFDQGGYDYSFTDADRTCAVNYSGNLFTKGSDGYWTEAEDVTEYAEWSASM